MDNLVHSNYSNLNTLEQPIPSEITGKYAIKFVIACPHSPEDGNRSSARNVAFSRFQSTGG
jgi:hypothetical protein